MNQVEEVLVKTQDIPSIPFDGMLHYEGIKIGFDVYGKKSPTGYDVIFKGL
jgi:hypothetical protein